MQKGGSEILGYQIEVDDGKSGPYQIVLGEDANDPEAINLET